MKPFPLLLRAGFRILALLALAGAASGVLAAEHNIGAWSDARLAAGMPGVATDDTVVLPATAAAGAVLTIPAHLTSLTLRGRADYTDLTVKVVAAHPGLALTIDGFLATGGEGGAALEFGNVSTRNHLTIVGANTLVGGSGCAGLQVPYGSGVAVGGPGSLLAKGAGGGAGIGSARGMKGSGTITIVGGNITALGGGRAGETGGGGAGIGTGCANGPTGDIAILGGTVHATGGMGDGGGAGIGLGGRAASGGRILIRTANVTAIGFGGGAGIGSGGLSGGTEVSITGSTVAAIGGAGAAGIGGGFKGNGVLITITDSTVEAEGGGLTIDEETYGGAGIGSAGSGGGKAIQITGGTIIARGAVRSAGIGSGSKGGCPEITIRDAHITAVGGTGGAGLGTGYMGGCELLEVSGASVIGATGGTGGAGIGCGQVGGCRTIRLRAGEITATGGAGADDIGIGAACVTTGMRISLWAAALVHAKTISLTPLEVATEDVTGVATVPAAAAGEVRCSGSSLIRERGFVYATVAAPTLATGVNVPAGADMGAFATQLAGLLSGTTYHVRSYATNATETAYGEDVVLTTPTGAGLLAAFLQEHGLDPAAASGAPDADSDGDGVNNLLELVLGGDPSAGETGLLPAESVVIGGGTPVLDYSFVCTSAAAFGYVVTVESSPDLATWTAAVDGQGGVTIARVPFAGGETVAVRIPVVGARLFVRLRVAPR